MRISALSPTGSVVTVHYLPGLNAGDGGVLLDLFKFQHAVTALAEMGLLDMAFEAVVLRHPDLFSTEAIARSSERMEGHDG